ncbi:HNH endonuclease signature motif containing protein (plasmid) [Staphylococcus xylosus]|uniref:HNH endonuclease signature motif containing protein n=1 Tax=Staphylococcus xylosus TaxID=1288 RepID=UPI003CF87FEE
MLRHDSLCQECLRNGLYTQADVVDHIVELRDGYSRRLDQSNLEPLCHDCHNKKTYREKQRRLSEQNKNN